jgi:hypothetical protein
MSNAEMKKYTSDRRYVLFVDGEGKKEPAVFVNGCHGCGAHVRLRQVKDTQFVECRYCGERYKLQFTIDQLGKPQALEGPVVVD